MGEEVPVPAFFPSSSQTNIRQFYASETGKYNFGDYPNTNGVYLQGMRTSSGISVNGTFVMGNNYVNFGISAGNGGYGFGVSAGGSIMVRNMGGDWTVITDIGSGGSSTSPGGSNSQVQFNDNGIFGGVSNFTWNTNSNTLTVRDTVLIEETNQGLSSLVISGGVSDSTNSYIGSTTEMKRRKNDGTSIISPFTFDAPNLEMVLRNDNSGASVSFGMSTSQTSATKFILPTGNGTNGYVLETNGSGNTNWTAPTNSFSTISVDGVDDIVSTSSTDILTLEAGTNMSITADIPNKKVIFTSSGGGGGGGGTPSGEDNSIQYKDGVSFAGDASFKFFTQHPTSTGGVSTVSVDGNLFSGMGVCDKQSGTSGTYQISATDFVNGFIFPPCQSSDENQLFVVRVPTYTQIRSKFGALVLKEGQTFDTVIYGTSIGSSPAIGVSFPSDITVLESSDGSAIFDRRLVSDKTISGGLSFHFAGLDLKYYQGVVIRSRMGSAGVSMYPYATSFYTC